MVMTDERNVADTRPHSAALRTVGDICVLPSQIRLIAKPLKHARDHSLLLLSAIRKRGLGGAFLRLVVDSVGGGLAAFGMLNPLISLPFIHVTSKLTFILNSVNGIRCHFLQSLASRLGRDGPKCSNWPATVNYED